MNNLESLEAWIQPQHLSSHCLEVHNQTFNSHTAKVLQISSFLNDDIANGISQFLMRDAVYQTIYGLYSTKGHSVSASTWLSKSQKERFYTYELLAKVVPHKRFSPNLLSFMRFRQILTTTIFKQYLSRITNLSLEQITAINVHRMKYGHYLKAHNDRFNKNRLAFIFYLSPHWRPNYGGALKIIETDKKSTQFEAIYNSLILFDVTQHKQHYVSNIHATAGKIARLTIGGWFTQAD